MSLQPARRRRILGGDIVPDSKGLRLFLDARYGVTVDGANRVSQWKNRADDPSALYARQATEAMRPQYVAARQNSHPALVFDGTDDYMAVDPFAAAIAQPMTVIWAGKTPVSSTGPETIYDGGTSGTRQALSLYIEALTGYAGNQVWCDNDPALGAPTILSVYWNGDPTYIFYNGAHNAITPTDAGSHSLDRYMLGVNHLAESPTSMDMYAMLAFDRLLGDEERRQVEVNMANIWGISVAL